MNEIFLEAESFNNLGGWVVDTTSFEILHSAYLMAHGLGTPVEDAETEFLVCETSEYYVWVLTRDWTATWNTKMPAGRFRIGIDGTELCNDLGTNGKEWSWQLAGKLFITKGKHKMFLHDLTGFNGRCDAIYLTDRENAPDDTEELRKRLNWKKTEKASEEYDFAVVGGGIAGICTALSAIRCGVKTVLINDREILGGCNSSEIRVCMGGQIKHTPYDNIGEVVRQIAPVLGHPTLYEKKYFEDDRKELAFRLSTGYTLMMNNSVTDIIQAGNEIKSVICTNTRTGKKVEIKAKIFCDCSGDGILARLSGAESMYGREAKSEFGESLGANEHENLVMGHSIRWYAEKEDNYSHFPDFDWNLEFNEQSYLNCISGDWEQETGFRRDMVKDTEYIRDYGLRSIYANWNYQKNHCKDRERFSNYRLKWVSPFGGKRESYRIKGDYILTQRDLEDETTYNDGTAAVSWGIDIHFPEPKNEAEFGEAFRSFAYHRGMPRICRVPYRCLYSKDVSNLFIGGRLISASHVAFSAARVMRTLGMLGEVTGLAMSLCKKYNCYPRKIYQSHLDELKELMVNGVVIPDAFSCGGISQTESYHYKDMQWWYLHTGKHTDELGNDIEETRDEIAKFKKGVETLGLEHKFPIPEKWK